MAEPVSGPGRLVGGWSAASWLALLLAGSALVNLAGLTWGLPSAIGWAPDEILPSTVLEGAGRSFSGGWHDRYPPLHYALLALTYLPFRALIAVGAIAPAAPDQGLLFYVGRVVSVVMATATVALVAQLGREAWNRRAGLYAAAIVAVMPTFVYHAKLATVDGPMLFWFTAAMLFWLRLRRARTWHTAVAFAVAATLAVCTKDMAYGYFVLPTIALVVTALRDARAAAAARVGHGGPAVAPERLASVPLATIAAALTFVVGQNLLFDWAGFRQHVALIVGPASADYAMFDRGLAGQFAMLRTAGRQVAWVLGWPAAVACAAGVAMAWRTGQRETVTWLLLPVMSFYLTFVAVVRYHYDRFFLGACVLLAIFGGAWLDHVLQPGTRARRLRVIVTSIAGVYLVTRAVSIDALMIHDARYLAERWLVRHAHEQASVTATGLPEYLPRREVRDWAEVPAAVDALRQANPDFLVVNAQYMRRFDPGSPRAEFMRALRSGRARYDLAARFTWRPAWLPLTWEAPFRDDREDAFTNLDKVSPEIEVYSRCPQSDTAHSPGTIGRVRGSRPRYDR